MHHDFDDKMMDRFPRDSYDIAPVEVETWLKMIAKDDERNYSIFNRNIYYSIEDYRVKLPAYFL